MERDAKEKIRCAQSKFDERKSTRRLGVESGRFRGREIWRRGDGGKVCFVAELCRRRNVNDGEIVAEIFNHNSEKRGRGKSSGFVVEYSSPQNHIFFDDFQMR